MPLGEGAKDIGRIGARAAALTIAAAGAGAATGASIAGMRILVLPVPLLPAILSTVPAVAWIFSLFAVLAAGHALELLRLPVPQRSWAVPQTWVLRGYYKGAILFGAGVGMGFLTFNKLLTFHALMAWIAIAGNIEYGAVLGAAFGLARSFPVLLAVVISVGARETRMHAEHWLMHSSQSLRRLDGLALSFFGGALLVQTLA